MNPKYLADDLISASKTTTQLRDAFLKILSPHLPTLIARSVRTDYTFHWGSGYVPGAQPGVWEIKCYFSLTRKRSYVALDDSLLNKLANDNPLTDRVTILLNEDSSENYSDLASKFVLTYRGNAEQLMCPELHTNALAYHAARFEHDKAVAQAALDGKKKARTTTEFRAASVKRAAASKKIKEAQAALDAAQALYAEADKLREEVLTDSKYMPEVDRTGLDRAAAAMEGLDQ